MTVGTLQVGGRKFRVISERDFQALCRQAKAGASTAKNTARKPRKRNPAKTLVQMNAWMTDHWDEVVAKAKSNTKHLTGREVL